MARLAVSGLCTSLCVEEEWVGMHVCMCLYGSVQAHTGIHIPVYVQVRVSSVCLPLFVPDSF